MTSDDTPCPIPATVKEARRVLGETFDAEPATWTVGTRRAVVAGIVEAMGDSLIESIEARRGATLTDADRDSMRLAAAVELAEWAGTRWARGEVSWAEVELWRDAESEACRGYDDDEVRQFRIDVVERRNAQAAKAAAAKAKAAETAEPDRFAGAVGWTRVEPTPW